MKSTTSSSILLPTFAIRETLAILLATMLLPFLVHLIPFSGEVPLGARLLPLFYAPLVAVFYFRWHVGLLPGMIAPWLNYLLTGQPQWEIVLLLSTELSLFVGWVFLLKEIPKVRWFSGPLAYLLTKTISSALISFFPIALAPMHFWLNSVQNAIIGILILGFLTIFIQKVKKEKY